MKPNKGNKKQSRLVNLTHHFSITTFFEIAEPRIFGLYPQRYIHIGDEINCSNIENWLKFLLKKLSAEKNQNP